ncbi:hypothetical protein M9H77_20096 [Catharanthus roseus]|uniref:Uncharacterized protein n=1 Tax=Catharanthus roseus TaxID=4058 RepID=A0ACC0AMX3_CATRO|nr:hypothetical protein M9H77_20096 [Catharanthus roseus]
MRTIHFFCIPPFKVLALPTMNMEKIEDMNTRQIAFAKRRKNLFKQARELSKRSGFEIGIVVVSPTERVYSFGTPSIESVIERYETTQRLNQLEQTTQINDLNLEEPKTLLKSQEKPMQSINNEIQKRVSEEGDTSLVEASNSLENNGGEAN